MRVRGYIYLHLVGAQSILALRVAVITGKLIRRESEMITGKLIRRESEMPLTKSKVHAAHTNKVQKCKTQTAAVFGTRVASTER